MNAKTDTDDPLPIVQELKHQLHGESCSLTIIILWYNSFPVVGASVSTSQTVLHNHLEGMDEGVRDRIHTEFRANMAKFESEAEQNMLMLELILKEYAADAANARKVSLSQPFLFLNFRCYASPRRPSPRWHR